ncbi:peroxisome proliferator-activated receptor gamma coactivator-related protein 1 [Pelobates fuscus]|uniref:peroxisome proliferator-activated receptor gamma coactivator-related protein 1 n=1 Tax=Pelobates fuscus TaxID=191477 RepID=UPI002FE43FAF
MAARWGAGEETLTIGGMELFTAGGPLQCQVFEDDEPCSGLSDLSLSSLDAGGILGTFHGYVDPSLISVIEDPGTQNKGNFDEENELSLLTALTEILDNTDDENMSPFDTIPDTELLVSSKDREGSALQKFLSLSRTPTDIALMDEQHRPSSGKNDRSVSINWEQCLEGITSTPKRRNRLKSFRNCLPRRARTEPTQQRSDGEEEELASPSKAFEATSSLITFDKDVIDSPFMKTDFEQEALLKQNTPYVINTENVALCDLVKYMHPYCLPTLTVCLDEEDTEVDEDILENAVFLEIVSEQGDCIKVPVMMKHPGEDCDSEDNIINLCSMEQLDSEVGIQTHYSNGSSEEQCSPVQQQLAAEEHFLKASDEIQSLETLTDQDNEEKLKMFSLENEQNNQNQESLREDKPCQKELEVPSELGNGSIQNNEAMAQHSDGKLKQGEEFSLQKNNEVDCSAQKECENTVVNHKRIKKKQGKSSKLKVKIKPKNSNENKELASAKISIQKVLPPTLKRPSNALLQESDFLIKQLDQAKKDAEMELRTSRMTRAKLRTRASLENLHSSEKKLTHDKKPEKPCLLENDQPALVGENGDINVCLEPNNFRSEVSGMITSEHSQDVTHAPDSSVQNKTPEEVLVVAPSAIQLEENASMEDKNPGSEGESTLHAKDLKPKSLSLSEYRKRLQNRKPNAEERDSENSSGSKWPSIPEPPTELAEIPCLILPGKDALPSKSTKPTRPLEETACSSTKADKPLGQDFSNGCMHAQPFVSTHETVHPQPPAVMNPSVAVNHPFALPLQQNVPTAFYPPTWPVSSHLAYYPTPPAVPSFHNCVPPDPTHAITMQPPMMTWPHFPPPPIAMGAVHSSEPAGWPPGFPPSYWQPPLVHQGIPVQASAGNIVGAIPQSLSNLANNHMQPELKISHDVQAAAQSYSQNVMPFNQISMPGVQESRPPPGWKETSSTEIVKPVKDNIKQSKAHAKPLENKTPTPVKHSCSLVQKSSPNKPTINQLPKKHPDPLPPDPKKTNLPVPDMKSANQVVFKIMELLKKAQSKVVQMKSTPEPAGPVKESPPACQQPLNSACIQLARCERSETPIVANPGLVVVPEMPQVSAPVLAVESKTLEQVAVDKPLAAEIPKIKDSELAQVSTLAPPQETRLPTSLSAAGDHSASRKVITCEEGIEASDLTSLLEQFEKTEAKDEHVAQSPDSKLAVGNSGSEKPVDKKILDRLLAPELASTAGLTPPATPPHQLWKPVIARPLSGKSKPLLASVQERTCASPVKTTKLIEAQPLPQSKLRNRNPVPASKMTFQPVHVASGDHDYCILPASQTEKCPISEESKVETITSTASSTCEGSRWNVKHGQNIMIMPIVEFNKRPENKICPKLPKATSTAPSSVLNQSVRCNVNSELPSNTVQKNLREPLDHRTNNAVEAEGHSVFMSPDSSPCRNESLDTRTEDRRDNTSVSRRSLRCYRKYKVSPSPEKSSSRGRKSSDSHSCRSSSSSSFSGSRSRSPPSKRRRTFSSRRCRSRSSESTSSSCSSSSSSSCSSRTCSSSSSRSRSRSRSRETYRSRSRRCESRERYSRQRIQHKERAIEERRVVYIGKINNRMTRSELKRRFSVFGDIEECTIHFREHGDNYGFVTYRHAGEAFTAIENGHKLRLPDELPFDLCFGGRRQFCKSNYADLDSNRDDYDPASMKSKFKELDFDTLLKQAQKIHRR